MKKYLDLLVREQEQAKIKAVAKRPEPGVSCDYTMGFSQGYFAGLVEAQKLLDKYIKDEESRDFEL